MDRVYHQAVEILIKIETHVALFSFAVVNRIHDVLG